MGMKLKKYGEVTEGIDYSAAGERIAKRLGYEVGDTVYNKIMKKYLRIVLDSRSVIDDKTSSLCTLASVGESPGTYQQVNREENTKKSVERLDVVNRVKAGIKHSINKGLVTKAELKKEIDELFNELD